ncbi:MAG: hypothetical protein K2Z81_00735 [Cyanobacteria bacterium]|nr:hypothetical protein [Cyanobacteriota bacterium]
MRFPGEQEALEQVKKMAEIWGYGNCIQYLHYKWAETLMKEHAMDAEAAARGALMSEEDVAAFVAGRRL